MKSSPKLKIDSIMQILDDLYPGAHTALHFSDPFELLVAVELSAQCTDVRVNMVTDNLFKRYRTPYDFSTLSEAELIPIIKPCGLYNNKARNIILCAKAIVNEFGGNIPDTIDRLLTLPGVGRKTANIILAVLFNKPAFPVDTHVFRVSRRLGLSHAKDPYGVEIDLKRLFPEEKWISLHHQIIAHGRRLCVARKPLCHRCPLSPLCEYYLHSMK